jgi:pentatricopeptide repeat protein
MLAGSTSSIRLSPASSQVSCWLRQVQQLFALRQATFRTFQVHRRIHAARMVKERAQGEVSCAVSEHKASDALAALVDHSDKTVQQTRVLKPSGQDGLVPRAPLPTDESRDVEAIHIHAGIRSTHGQQNPRHHYPNAYYTGHQNPIDSLEETPPDRLKTRQELLDSLLRATSVADGWEVYRTLTVMFPHHIHHLSGVPNIPQRHLHHLARLLASTKPRTRTLFLRLSAVLTMLHRSGYPIYLWEWNALLDCAGKRWRKCSLEDYKAAVEVFNKMTTPRPSENLGDDENLAAEPGFGHVQPDIITYTTLLYIAGRSLDPSAIRHASNLLRASGLPPNRITHLSLLYYYTRTKQLSGVRSTLQKMREQGFEPGLDGINACIWAYARNGHMDVASTIYRVLRHNLQPELDVGEYDIEAAVNYLLDVEGIAIRDNIIPDEITYTSLIQAFAYHGQIMKALHVFVDMLSTPNKESKAPINQQTGEPSLYQPTLAAFRGIFLGFARHAQKPLPLRPIPGSLSERLRPIQKNDWNLDNLHQVFKSFMDLPADVMPSERLIYWILVSFNKASGNDAGKLRKVFLQLEQRFGGGWGGRLDELRKSIFGNNGSGGQ